MSRSDLVKAMLKRREEKRQLELARRDVETEAAPPELVSSPWANTNVTVAEGIEGLSSVVQPETAGQELVSTSNELAAPTANGHLMDSTQIEGAGAAPPAGKKALTNGLC